MIINIAVSSSSFSCLDKSMSHGVYVKSMSTVRIWSYSGPYFPGFGQNMDHNNPEYAHFLRSVNEFIIILMIQKM